MNKNSKNLLIVVAVAATAVIIYYYWPSPIPDHQHGYAPNYNEKTCVSQLNHANVSLITDVNTMYGWWTMILKQSNINPASEPLTKNITDLIHLSKAPVNNEATAKNIYRMIYDALLDANNNMVSSTPGIGRVRDINIDAYSHYNAVLDNRLMVYERMKDLCQ